MNAAVSTTTRHGTTAGWSKHKAAGERPCVPCYQAKQAYDRRRKEAPEIRRKDRLYAKAQWAAHQRLAKLYPDLYRLFYEEAKAQVLAEAAGS